MPKDIKLFRIFIGSPGDVAKERTEIENFIYKYNYLHAIPEGLYFHVLRWENLASRAVHRPQDIINQELEKCDFSIILFWKKWGSPPNRHDNKYTSGVEEEYHESIRLFKSKNKPMRDVGLYFKKTDNKQKQAEWEQLQKVLDFKSSFAGNEHLYKEFDRKSLYSELDSLLTGWVFSIKEEESNSSKTPFVTYSLFQKKHIDHIPLPSENNFNEDNKELIKELDKVHQYSETDEKKTKSGFLRIIKKYENNYAKVVFARNDYAKFLYRIGELVNAENIFKSILHDASLSTDLGWMARASVNLALIEYHKGYLLNAEKLLKASLKYNGDLEHDAGIADCFRHIGNINRIKGKLSLAKKDIEKSLEMFTDINYTSGIADSSADLGIIYRILGDYDKALDYQNKSLDLNRSANRKSCCSDNLGHIGTVEKMMGLFGKAKNSYEEALTINRELGRRHGISSDLGRLGALELDMLDTENAEDKLTKALKISKSIEDREATAKHNSHLGKLYVLNNKYDLAERHLNEAMENNEFINSREGRAAVNYHFAWLHLKTNIFYDALSEIDESLKLYQEMACPQGVVDCLGLKAKIEDYLGRSKNAVKLCKESIRICGNIGAPYSECLTRETLCLIYLKSGDMREFEKEVIEIKKLPRIVLDEEFGHVVKKIVETINKQKRKKGGVRNGT